MYPGPMLVGGRYPGLVSEGGGKYPGPMLEGVSTQVTCLGRAGVGTQVPCW